MSAATLACRYAAFAAIATVLNLGAQRVVLGATSGPLALPLALVVGTAVGLVVKFWLDKRWIFEEASAGVRADARQLALYSVMGVVTTAIFWGAELLFWAVWRTQAMRELGAVLGLAIGYAVKYLLDRRYVFLGAVAAK